MRRVGTFIFERPRPLSRQRRADDLYTLNCEEPDNRVSTTHTTSTTTPQANNVSKVESNTTQDWSPQAPDAAKRTSSVSQSRTTEYPYRMPGLDNEANYERAQSSLQEERITAVAATNYASGDNYERPDVGGLRYFMNDLKSIDLDVKLLQIAYLNTLLISPIDGVVTGIYRNVGDNVSAGQPVMRVENDSEVYIVGVLKYRGLIRLGQQAQITTDLFESGQQLATAGEVVSIRGHDSENELWDVLIRCNNRTGNNESIYPLNYNFDFDETVVDLA